jgi:hypothetical protein
MEKQIDNEWDHNERIVSFETAKLAKELGFPQYIMKMRWYNKNGELTDKPFGTDIKAPRQSLLQKWLREKFNNWITIYARAFDYKEPNDCKVMWENNANRGDLFKSYEEALEDSLLFCLRRIKLEKTKI